MSFRGQVAIKFFGVLTVASVALGCVNGQTLKRRGGIVTPQLQKVYESPDFDAAYQAAEVTYDASRPRMYAPYLWDAKRPLLWIGYKQSEFGRYTLEFESLENQLDEASENVQTRNNPEKVAQLSQIQDRLTEENFKALNAMIAAVDLGTLFTSNEKQQIADLWTAWQIPEGKQLLDESKMKEVLKFMSTVIKCFYESRNYPVRFASSASFSANFPRGADNKPLTTEEASSYWRWDNHGPVDTAIASLYNSLHQAQQTAAKEGLLHDNTHGLSARK